MANTDAQPTAPAAQAATLPAQPAESAESNVYRMSREGRRQAYILLIGVLSIIVFAVWSLVTILDGGLTGAEWVSALLMLGIIVVAPAVAWTLLEEANSRITLADNGLRFTSIGGVDVRYRWEQLYGFQGRGQRGRVARFFLGDEDDDAEAAAPGGSTGSTNNTNDTDNSDEEGDSEADAESVALRVREQYRGELARQLANPAVRFLYTQAHGNTVPIYGGLENRDELVSRIASHLATNE